MGNHNLNNCNELYGNVSFGGGGGGGGGGGRGWGSARQCSQKDPYGQAGPVLKPAPNSRPRFDRKGAICVGSTATAEIAGAVAIRAGHPGVKIGAAAVATGATVVAAATCT